VVLLDLKSSILREITAFPRVPKAVFFRLAQFLLEALWGLILSGSRRRVGHLCGWSSAETSMCGFGSGIALGIALGCQSVVVKLDNKL